MQAPKLTLNADGTFTLTGVAEQLKNFFDILEVVEGDVEDCVEQNTSDIDPESWTPEEALDVTTDYYAIKHAIEFALYPMGDMMSDMMGENK